MNRIVLFWILGMLLSLGEAAATASLSIESFSISGGETKEMVIDLDNPSTDITLVQFDLRLPTGLTLKQTDGEYDIDIAGRTTWRKHSLDANAQADGSIRFLLASSSNTVLSGSSGAIISMTLVASNSFNGGDIKLENILMVSPDEQDTKQATYTYTIGNAPPAPTGTATLSIEPFTISKGGEAEMLIDVNNPDNEVTLVQFDLRLPAGLTLKQTDGEYEIDIAGRTTWRKHSLDANLQSDGSIRFLLASSSNAALSGTSGAVITMTLQASSTFGGGIVKLENALLVSPDETESKPATYQYEVKPATTITITAKNCRREYGNANPTFEYEVSGGTPTGTPTLTCSATKTSDVGTYEIVVGKGTLQGDVVLVNGTLTVTKAPLTASVGDYTREEGQENPTFVIAYSGWKNADNENVLTKKPVATTTATASSAPGTYPITVSGGEAKNYEFTYKGGTLTVTKIPLPPGTATLSIESFDIRAGQTKEMVIDLTNPDDEITLVQFDLRLPNGLTIAIEDGEYAIDIAGRTTWKKHSLDANATDGIVRFLLSSTKNAVLEGTSGAIISIKLIADNSFTGGSISLENILLVTPNEKELKPANVEYTIQPVGDIAINATNFPDKNFRDFLLKQSYGMDGVITKEEIDEIKEMDVTGKEIESLKGIEFFTALTELICGYDRLTSLDVSKNTALISLECRYTQLTSLDVSKNTALTHLYCWDNHLLTSLDVSKNTALTTLFCDNNQLTSLDVSNNPALTWIYCPYNQLTSLDVSNDTALKILECDSNQLTSLDVSKNTALTSLTCENNQLTSLDVSKNTMLKLLRFSSNHLSTIDISKNTALTDLICSSNQLISLDVSKNAALKYITCDLNMIKGVAMDALINSLPYNSSSNDYGSLKLINDSNEEGNVCTVSQVAAAKSKGWGVLYYNNEKEKWLDYEGSPSGINDVINDSNTRNIPVYTISGQRLTAPRKGVNIVGGKKVVVR